MRTSRGDDRAVAFVLEALDRAYDIASWHGPNLRGSLRRVDHVAACWRPAPGRHSIAEQVLHAAYWKYAARRRLTGAPRGSFPLAGTNWFPLADPYSASAWRDDLGRLEAQHQALRAAIAGLSPSRLDEPPLGRRGTGEAAAGITCRALILGVAAHDLYHAGQIQLLKRLREGAAGP